MEPAFGTAYLGTVAGRRRAFIVDLGPIPHATTDSFGPTIKERMGLTRRDYRAMREDAINLDDRFLVVEERPDPLKESIGHHPLDLDAPS
jgi:hypothetical protein